MKKIILSIMIISMLLATSIACAADAVMVNKPLAYYANFTNTEQIEPQTYSTSNLLPEQLVIKKGDYSVFGNVYNLNREGLYRFINPLMENKQRIVFEKDIDSLMSSLSWIVTHGFNDGAKTIQEKNQISLNNKLYMNCGPTSLWVQSQLTALGIKSRIVAGLTLEEWNKYDNGHTMIEVYRQDLGKWVLYDIDNNTTFLKGLKPLNVYELSDAIKNNESYQIIYLANDSTLDASQYNVGGYSLTMYQEMYSGEAGLRKWYKRVLQVPLVCENGRYYFYDLTNKAKVESYSTSYKYIPREEFMLKYYN